MHFQWGQNFLPCFVGEFSILAPPSMGVLCWDIFLSSFFLSILTKNMFFHFLSDSVWESNFWRFLAGYPFFDTFFGCLISIPPTHRPSKTKYLEGNCCAPARCMELPYALASCVWERGYAGLDVWGAVGGFIRHYPFLFFKIKKKGRFLIAVYQGGWVE